MQYGKPKFKYIITTHNKENLIRNVLKGVLSVSGVESRIYPVLDGCTDQTENIIDQIIAEEPQRHIHKLYANDVHELRSINIGLNAASQSIGGFNIILQDDVLLKDKDQEAKLALLYRKYGNLGIVSFRHGANLSRDMLKDPQVMEPFCDYLQSEYGHYPKPQSMLREGHVAFREIAIKSPICIPSYVINQVGLPEEVYAPWDDMAYCYKISLAGFRNAIYALPFQSEVEWGSTRTKQQKFQVEHVIQKNILLFKRQYPNLQSLDLDVYGQGPQLFHC
jgi:glycosyltransferase involved in cell wall biosynthesis